MKKSFLIVFICISSVLLISGCGGKGQASPDEQFFEIEIVRPAEPEPLEPETDLNTDSDKDEDKKAGANLKYSGAEIEAWARGCSAILATRNELDPYEFGMLSKNKLNADRAKTYLTDSWNCYGRDAVISLIARMTDHGHNEDFAELYDTLSILPSEEFDMLGDMFEDVEDFMWALTLELGDKWGDKQIKAWDWYRMIHVAGWGYVAGYFELEEAYEYMSPSIDRLKRTFTSWDEANDNYLDGFAWWSHADIIGGKKSDALLEYLTRLAILEELKKYPPEESLFDPSVWEGRPDEPAPGSLM